MEQTPSLDLYQIENQRISDGMSNFFRELATAVPQITKGAVIVSIWSGLSLSALFPIGLGLARLNADRVSSTSILPLWAMVMAACIIGAHASRGIGEWWRDLSLVGRAFWGPISFAIGICSFVTLVLVAQASM